MWANLGQNQNNLFSDGLSEEARIRLSSLCSEDGSVVASEGGYEGDEESVNFSSSENLPAMVSMNVSTHFLHWMEIFNIVLDLSSIKT